MLAALGAPVDASTAAPCASRAGAPAPFELDVPGDPSSAAFFVVARRRSRPAPRSSIEDVALNPTRHRLRRRAAAHGRRHRDRRDRRAAAASRSATCASRARAAARHDDRRRRDPDRAATRSPRSRSRPRSPTASPRSATPPSCGSRRATASPPSPGAARSLGIGGRSRAPTGSSIRGGRPQPARAREPRRPPHRDGGGGRGQRDRRRVDGARAGARSASSYPEFADDLAALDRRRRVNGRRERRRDRRARRARASRRWRAGSPHALGLQVLDTGAMYRAVTLAALDAAASTSTTATRVRRGRRASRRSRSSDGVTMLDGRDVSAEIRGPEVTGRGVDGRRRTRGARGARRPPAGVGRASTAAEWSKGRDIGTVVFPDAPVKVFLTARDDERAAPAPARRSRRGARRSTSTTVQRRARPSRRARRARSAASPLRRGRRRGGDRHHRARPSTTSSPRSSRAPSTIAE